MTALISPDMLAPRRPAWRIRASWTCNGTVITMRIVSSFGSIATVYKSDHTIVNRWQFATNI